MKYQAPRKNEIATAEQSLSDLRPDAFLRGMVFDDYGSGSFELLLEKQRGFRLETEFIPSRAGLSVFHCRSLQNVKTPCGGESGRTIAQLNYQYSIIPANDFEVNFVELKVSGSPSALSGLHIILDWHGSGLAEMREPGPGSETRVVTRISPGQEVVLPGPETGAYPYKFRIPSRSVKLALVFHGGGNIDLHFGAIFAGAKQNCSRLPFATPGYGLEGGAKPGSGKPRNKNAETIVTEVPNIDLYEQVSSKFSRVKTVIRCQELSLTCGETIVLATAELFGDVVKNEVFYSSANLPDWLVLDKSSGEIMGTVPDTQTDGCERKFEIFAVDDEGHLAKAKVYLRWVKPASCSQNIDHKLAEGSAVELQTIHTFIDFGLDVSKVDFSATGLPRGLFIDQVSGIISGAIRPGSASPVPYKVGITATDKGDKNSGISMELLLLVTSNPQAPLSGTETLEIADKLRQLNPDLEQPAV